MHDSAKAGWKRGLAATLAGDRQLRLGTHEVPGSEANLRGKLERAFCKNRSGAGHHAGEPEVLSFSISGATWREMLSDPKKHKSHKLFFVPFVAVPDKRPAAESCKRLRS